MYANTNPDFANWLQRRGVPIGAAHRAAYLNRNVTPKQAKELGEDNTLTYGQQAATALHAAFDYRDTREGRSYWQDLEEKLNQQP
jgi:hypothetical protein